MNATATVLALALLTPAAAPMPVAPDVKENVQKGLKWLVSQQKEDGSWTGGNNKSPTTVTATAGLALLMEGSTLTHGTYATNIRKAVAWIEKNAGANGLLTHRFEIEISQSVASHAHAMLFLACVYDVDDDEDRRKRLAKLLERAVEFAGQCQTARGGWGYVHLQSGNEFDEGDTTANVLRALLAVRKTGISVPKKCTDKAIDYLVKCTNRDGAIFYSLSRGPAPMGGDGQTHASASAANALLTHDGFRPQQLPGWLKFANKYNYQSLRFLRDSTGGAYAFIQQYHLARTMFALGETGYQRLEPGAADSAVLHWSAFREPLFKLLKEIQKKDGSWSDLYIGPAYTTALALIILQLDNNYLPAFSR